MARNLMDVMDDNINTGRITENEQVDVCDDAYISNHPKIRAEFRYVRRKST